MLQTTFAPISLSPYRPPSRHNGFLAVAQQGEVSTKFLFLFFHSPLLLWPNGRRCSQREKCRRGTLPQKVGKVTRARNCK